TPQNPAPVRLDLHFLIRLPRHLGEGIDIDADWEATGYDLAILDLDAIVFYLIVELVLHIVLQIAEVGIGLEPYDVEFQQAFDKPAMLRHGCENFGRGKGNVEEEPDPLRASELA